MPALKSVRDCFVTSKILEKPDDVVFSQHDTDFDCIDSDIVTLFSDDIGLATLIIGDDDFDEGESTTINDVRLMAWCNKFKQHKACKNQQRINTILCIIVGGSKIGNFWKKKNKFYLNIIRLL